MKETFETTKKNNLTKICEDNCKDNTYNEYIDREECNQNGKMKDRYSKKKKSVIKKECGEYARYLKKQDIEKECEKKCKEPFKQSSKKASTSESSKVKNKMLNKNLTNIKFSNNVKNIKQVDSSKMKMNLLYIIVITLILLYNIRSFISKKNT